MGNKQMITDKDREEANGVYAAHLGGGIEYAAIEVSRIRAESADQARKEAAEIAVAFVDNNLMGIADCDIGLLTDLRDAILGDSVVKENLITEHIPDTGKKLAIAVKALEEISHMRDDQPDCNLSGDYLDAWDISNDALKDIQ